jgi:hypothetical protein
MDSFICQGANAGYTADAAMHSYICQTQVCSYSSTHFYQHIQITAHSELYLHDGSFLALGPSSAVLKIAGQEHPDRHRPTLAIKQWMAPAVDTQLNQLFHTQFRQVMSPGGRYELYSPLTYRRHLLDSARLNH